MWVFKAQSRCLCSRLSQWVLQAGSKWHLRFQGKRQKKQSLCRFGLTVWSHFCFFSPRQSCQVFLFTVACLVRPFALFPCSSRFVTPLPWSNSAVDNCHRFDNFFFLYGVGSRVQGPLLNGSTSKVVRRRKKSAGSRSERHLSGEHQAMAKRKRGHGTAECEQARAEGSGVDRQAESSETGAADTCRFSPTGRRCSSFITRNDTNLVFHWEIGSQPRFYHPSAFG